MEMVCAFYIKTDSNLIIDLTSNLCHNKKCKVLIEIHFQVTQKREGIS